MAGSFGVFRQYEKAALAGLAILAMLAFFVIPPFLQMGPSAGMADPVAVSWKGGGLRESGLQRAVLMRRAANQLLVDSLSATGRAPTRMPLPDDEKNVVDTLLLAQEATASGIVVSNETINRFLRGWTNDLVRPEQFDAIVSQIGGRVGLGQQDVFEALRQVLLADRMRELLVRGVDFSGTPPGWMWDYYRRLEQSATAELIPVVVETFGPEVAEPSEAQLRSFFDRYKDDLPVARSADPGFRQPHRIRYDYLVPRPDAYVDEERPKITDAQIAASYEERKESLYKAKPADAEAEKAAGEKAADKEGDEKGDTKPGESDAAGTDNDKDKEQDQEQDKAGADAAFEPLDKVADDVRRRLAEEAADRRLAAVFDAVKADVAKYGESLALWQVAGDGAGPRPSPPDVRKIAEQQGLTGGSSELVNRLEAIATPGIGGSFQLAMSREFGVQQQRWSDLLFDRSAPLLQPVGSRDVEGNRYLSWKSEDQEDFVPSFPAVREDVTRAWRIVESRPLAEKAAETLAAEARDGGKTLEAVAAARGGLEVSKVGPFTWLDRGTAPFGSAPELSQPDGLSMPGEDFMKAVFSLEPGQVATAFNEPRTVCYVIRLAALEPGDAQLKELFVAAARDPRRIAVAADGDAEAVFERWTDAVERRHEVAWKRDPRAAELP